MLKRYTSVLLAFFLVISCIPAHVFAINTADVSLQALDSGLKAGVTYIFENTGTEDANVTAMGSVSKNVRADWIILSSDGALKSHGNYGYICYLQDLAYTLSSGEKMIVTPISDHYGNTSVSFSWDSGISVTTTTKKPVTRYHLSKNATYSFSNDTVTNQSFFLSGDINHGAGASANIYADFVFEDTQKNIKSIGCGNTIALLENVCITLNPGDKYMVRPRKDGTSKQYVVAYTLNYGMDCDISFSSSSTKPITRINLQKGYDYTITNTTTKNLPLYFSGQWAGADTSANIKANYSVYENGTLIQEYKGKYLSYTGNSKYSISENQLWKITPISDYYSNKSYIVAFVPYNVDENELVVSVDTASRYDETKVNMSLTIFENENDSKTRTDNYILSTNTNVIYDETIYPTNDAGVVLIPQPDTGSVTVEKEGFVSRTITAERLELSQKIYLQRESTGAPVISAVWVDNIDVRSQNYAIDLFSESAIALSVEIDWGESTYGSIALMQDARTVKFSGTTLTTVLSDNFDVSETIYIVAIDAAGNTTKKALKFECGTASGVPAFLDGFKFKLSDKISITLPDSIKPEFFAGTKVNVGVSSIVPVTIEAEDGKVFVAIGAELNSYDSKEGAKTFVKKFKDTGILDASKAESSLKKLKSFKQTYKNAIKYPKGSFGFDADFTILGFAEGYYDAQGNVTWLDGGVIINPSVSASANLPFSLGPVPMYFETSLSGDIEAQLNLIINNATKDFVPNGDISGTVALSGGLGIGIKKVLYGGGGVEGKLMPDWHIYANKQDYFKLSASVNAYAKVGIAFFEYKKNWDPFYNAVWVEYPKANTAAASLMSVSDFYDTANYEVKDLSYLNEDSDFTVNSRFGGATLMSLVPNAEYLSESLFKTNIYRESTPQLVSFEDGSKLAVWLDAGNSDINSVVLYYSYFNGTTWSNPAVVCQDGTLDYTPQLSLIGNTAYLVWQNATTAFTDADSLEDIAPNFDVSIAVFDPVDGFTTYTAVSPGLDMLPTLCGSENAIYLVWVKNEENDWFGNNNANSICYSVYENGNLGDVVTAYSELNSIDSVAANYNGTLSIAYCLDTDGDLSTSEDVRLYKNGVRVSSSEACEALPQYVGNVLYWSSNGVIVSESEMEVSEVASVGNYQIVESDGTKILVYTTSNGLTSTLNASYFNEESQMWCEPYELTEGNTFIGAFSASVSEDGVLEVLTTSHEVIGTYEDDDPYGEAVLALVALDSYCDLTMGELIYSEDEYSAGDAMAFSFKLTNCGSQTINSATITVSDEQGQVLSSIKMDDVIVPGQTITTSTYFNIDADATGQNIIITVTPDELTDVNDADNSQSAQLAFEDLSVEQASYGTQANGTTTLSANIVNYGYFSRQNIVVELREGSVDGTVVGTTNIASLDVLALDTITFDLANPNSEVYFITIKDSGDIFTANDSDYVAVLANKADWVTIDNVSETSAQLYMENEQAGRCIVAIYDLSGKMLTCGMTDVAENAGEVTVSYNAFSCETGYTVKVFLVNSAYVPIFDCVKKEF